MFLSSGLVSLILYCAQQLGVTLGVGAETIMLAAYLISMRDGIVDEKETQYARAIKRVMGAALGLMVLSGAAITALHAMAGESSIIFTPAFLFKWLLIILVSVLTLLRHKFSTSSIVEGVIGATWYALFVVHILAPVTGWINLFSLYGLWLVGFVLCFEILVLIRKDKKISKQKIKTEAPQKNEVTILNALPVPKPVSNPAIVLAPDLPKGNLLEKAKVLFKPAIPAALLAVPAPPPAASTPTTPPKEIKMTFAQNPSFDISDPSPKGKVTDTPFLPAVPALQPIPTAPPEALVPKNPLAMPESARVPITTAPGGTSTPLVQEGLSAMNVMPKAPDAKK